MVSADEKYFLDASQRAFGCFTRKEENKSRSPLSGEGVK